MRTANFFRAAGLIGLRAGFLAGGAAFLARDFPLRCAHLIFIAADIRLRAAALISRLPVADPGGRPRRGPKPSRAAMAWLIRLRSAVSSATIWLISMRSSVAG